MADPVLESSRNPHFFQPLLPDFQSHLTIPVKFYSVYIQGRYEGKNVELRSDACEGTWKVKMEGRRITFGWKEFALAHDFRIGDVVVFKHQGDLVFHVTGLGPSCCEIQYEHTSNKDNDDDEEEDNIRNLSMKQPVETEPKSSLSENPFVKLTPTPYSFEKGRLYLPTSFTRVHKLEKEGDKEIAMLDKHGVEWRVKLLMEKIYSRMVLGSGVLEFFKANDIKAYKSFVLELVWKDITTPMLKYSHSHPKSSQDDRDNMGQRVSSSQNANPFVKLTATPASLRDGRLYLPKSLTSHKLENGGEEITMVDKHGVEWPVKLVMEKRYSSMRLTLGLKEFFKANDIKPFESFVLELVWKDVTTPILKFSTSH